MRLVFAGTPEFAATILDALLDAGHDVACIYTQPDRPAGRGRRLRPGPVKTLAVARDLPVEQPVSLRRPEARASLASWQPRALVVAAYGLILPPAMLELPPLGCINVHASLLPRWRGAAPIQRALLAGDERTGVSIMQMDAGLDTGPVLARAACRIGRDDTAGTLHRRLAALGASTLLEALERATGPSPPRAEPQDEALATQAPRIAKREARIDWQATAPEIERLVRAFDPWPVAYTTLNGADDGRRLRVWRTRLRPDRAPAGAGTVIQADRSGLLVATGGGALELVEVQAPGGAACSPRSSSMPTRSRLARGSVTGEQRAPCGARDAASGRARAPLARRRRATRDGSPGQPARPRPRTRARLRCAALADESGHGDGHAARPPARSP